MDEPNELENHQHAPDEEIALSDMPQLERQVEPSPPQSVTLHHPFEPYIFVYDDQPIEFPPALPFTPPVPLPRFSRDYLGNNPSIATVKKLIKPKRKPEDGQKKPCNCAKSQCLKLYCRCFANGEFCQNCNCKDCHNNLEFEHERSQAVKYSLGKNSQAFRPKIGVAMTGEMERLHQKGCNCKKSNCLKNYCECYEAKVACSSRCKCVCCRNTEADRQGKFTEKFSIIRQLKHGSPISDDESDPLPFYKNTLVHPWHYLTDEVIETSTMCMLVHAHECEASGESNIETIKGLFKEFGQCMDQIFDAIRSSENNHHNLQLRKKD